MNKNLPNYITVFRLFLVIPFIIFLSAPLFSNSHSFPTYKTLNWQLYFVLLSGIIFIIAMITDYLDGYLARKHSIESKFGIFFDPIADKFIINSALIIFAVYQVIPVWLVIIIVLRDILVDGIRMVSSQNNIIVSASWFGKIKTTLFSIFIGIMFFLLPVIDNNNIYQNGIYIWLINIPLLISLIFSLIGAYIYLKEVKLC